MVATATSLLASTDNCLRIEWATGDRARAIPTWKGGQLVGSSIYHQISIIYPDILEFDDQMSDGIVYYAMPQVSVPAVFAATDSANIGGCDRIPT